MTLNTSDQYTRLLFGDGLFETMRFDGSTVSWWDDHKSRLLESAKKINIPLHPDSLESSYQQRCNALSSLCILKVLLTRTGTHEKQLNGPSQLIWSTRSLTAPCVKHVGVLKNVLPRNDPLAGIKHCSRIHYTQAIHQCAIQGWNEALLGDGQHCIEAIHYNIFYKLNDEWYTPPITKCGVLGIARKKMLQLYPSIKKRHLLIKECDNIQSLLLSNAVHGLQSVASLSQRKLDEEHPFNTIYPTLFPSKPL